MEAYLSGEPYFYTRDYIDSLDRWYIRNIIFYPRDKDGKLSIVSHFATEDDGLTEEQRFYRTYKDWDYPDWVIEKEWYPHSLEKQEYDKQQEENLKNFIADMKRQNEARRKQGG